MPVPSGQLISGLVRQLGLAARAQARPFVPSRTLREAMRVIVEADTSIVYIPHYWAVYVHDGRGPLDKRGQRGFLVFFVDPTDDPRTQGGVAFPVRASQIQRLSKEDFAYFSAINALRRRRGLEPIMVVTKYVGPVAPRPFFTEGLKTFPLVASKIVVPRFDSWIQGFVIAERDVAVARLG